MKKEEKGLLFDIQRYSLHDGAGIRTTVFFKGCPLRCLWCSNPESQNTGLELAYFKDRCIQCEQCAQLCPKEAIKYKEKQLVINRSLCNYCGFCTEQCPSGALRIVGYTHTLEETAAEIEKDKIFYKHSDGGVTLSGGEPTLQKKFALNLVEWCRRESIHIAVETCGYAGAEVMEEFSEGADLILYDLKHINPEQHKKFTGVSNDKILANLINIIKKKNVIIRVPLIPGYNDSQDNLRQTADFIKVLGGPPVHLLPYHRLGECKYYSLGRQFPMAGVLPQGKEQILKAAGYFRDNNLNTVIYGLE